MLPAVFRRCLGIVSYCPELLQSPVSQLVSKNPNMTNVDRMLVGRTSLLLQVCVGQRRDVGRTGAVVDQCSPGLRSHNMPPSHQRITPR